MKVIMKMANENNEKNKSKRNNMKKWQWKENMAWQ